MKRVKAEVVVSGLIATRLYHVPLTFKCVCICSYERSENGDGEDERMKDDEDNLILCGESQEDLKVMVC